MADIKFVNPSQLTNLLDTNNDNIFNLNFHSIMQKTDHLEMFLESTAVNFDVVMLTQTWKPKSYCMLPKYQHFALNCEHKSGGGVSIRNCSSLRASVIPDYAQITLKWLRF